MIFGRNGGIIQNLQTGSQTPFLRENGVYVLSMWLLDDEEQGFRRP